RVAWPVSGAGAAAARPRPCVPTRRSSDLEPFPCRYRTPRPTPRASFWWDFRAQQTPVRRSLSRRMAPFKCELGATFPTSLLITRSEEHTSELQSRENLVCRLLLEKKNTRT